MRYCISLGPSLGTSTNYPRHTTIDLILNGRETHRLLGQMMVDEWSFSLMTEYLYDLISARPNFRNLICLIDPFLMKLWIWIELESIKCFSNKWKTQKLKKTRLTVDRVKLWLNITQIMCPECQELNRNRFIARCQKMLNFIRCISCTWYMWKHETDSPTQ